MNKTYNYYILYSFTYLFLLFVFILISVAFFTLFERKVLSYIHNRVGPNKASFLGLTQPFSDALKLLSKEFIYSPKINYRTYIISPLIIILLVTLIWVIFPNHNRYVWSFNLSFLFILCCLRISVYPIILGGWSSNSTYALIGSIRGLAQTISYEVSLALILISCLVIFETLNFNDFHEYIQSIELRSYLWHSVTILYVSRLAEVNRTPFDFVEGESELVSGFNIEYFGFGFAFIFLAEYSIIIWISGLNTVVFFTRYPFILTTCVIAFSIVWVRATFPRIRYDELMYLCWKIFLPVRIVSLALLTIFKFFVISSI